MEKNIIDLCKWRMTFLDKINDSNLIKSQKCNQIISYIIIKKKLKKFQMTNKALWNRVFLLVKM